MVEIMKPILEDCANRKEFIGENGKYNKWGDKNETQFC
jgi:hypothetical protein